MSARVAAIRLAVARALLVVGALLVAHAARAGPKEARALWDRARAMRDAPWRERAAAYRAAVLEANPSDRLRVRALLALARVLRDADHAHGAAAVEALAAATGPERDETRIRALLDHARALRDEGDAETADRLLEEVARVARAEVPRVADQALDLRSEDALDRRDDATLLRVEALAERDRAAPHVRIRVAGRLGERLLAKGDEEGARRCLRLAEAALREVERRADEDALLATKAWLDLPLRSLLRA